ncbi:MAG: hypothetical protein PVH30_02090 [Desulfobacterales bacterium]
MIALPIDRIVPRLLFFAAGLMLVSGCASSPSTGQDGCRSFPHDPAAGRIDSAILEMYPLDYTTTVYDERGNPIFTFRSEYLGRCPDPSLYRSPNRSYSGPDFNENKVSFYRITVENKTSREVVLKRRISRLLFGNRRVGYDVGADGKPVLKTLPATATRDFAERPMPRGNAFGPHELRQYGAWRYSTEGEVWITETVIEFRGKEFLMVHHTVGH